MDYPPVHKTWYCYHFMAIAADCQLLAGCCVAQPTIGFVAWLLLLLVLVNACYFLWLLVFLLFAVAFVFAIFFCHYLLFLLVVVRHCGYCRLFFIFFWILLFIFFLPTAAAVFAHCWLLLPPSLPLPLRPLLPTARLSLECARCYYLPFAIVVVPLITTYFVAIIINVSCCFCCRLLGRHLFIF